jgi:hypothetical protein
MGWRRDGRGAVTERPVSAGNPIPHDHRSWAVIGVMHGSEENEFFRRSAHTIEPSGTGRVVAEGEVLMTGDETIHSMKDPSTDRLSSALHVYGGNLVAAEKTMWCEPDWTEEPFDFFRVIASSELGPADRERRGTALALIEPDGPPRRYGPRGQRSNGTNARLRSGPGVLRTGMKALAEPQLSRNGGYWSVMKRT